MSCSGANLALSMRFHCTHKARLLLPRLNQQVPSPKRRYGFAKHSLVYFFRFFLSDVLFLFYFFRFFFVISEELKSSLITSLPSSAPCHGSGFPSHHIRHLQACLSGLRSGVCATSQRGVAVTWFLQHCKKLSQKCFLWLRLTRFQFLFLHKLRSVRDGAVGMSTRTAPYRSVPHRSILYCPVLCRTVLYRYKITVNYRYNT